MTYLIAQNVIGDGMFWRRTIEPDINVRAILPVLVELVGSLLTVGRLPTVSRPEHQGGGLVPPGPAI